MLRATDAFHSTLSHSQSAALGLPIQPSPGHRHLTEQVVRPRLLPYLWDAGLDLPETDGISTYQRRAMDRLTQQPSNAILATMEDYKLVQYYVLYCIYEATNAQPNKLTTNDPRFQEAVTDPTTGQIMYPEWMVADGWHEPDGIGSWDPCGAIESSSSSGVILLQDPWHGVTCDEQGRITHIQLFDNRLFGIFPPELQLLAGDGPSSSSGAGNLVELDLFNNMYLFNDDDTSWMSRLGTTFEKLFVGSTGFSGSLPHLTPGIIEADFAFSLLDQGLVDEAFANATSLEYLNIGGVSYSTTLPSTLTSLPNLQFFYANGCDIRGDLNFLSSMPAIIELWLDSNPQLTSTIPGNLDQVSTLVSLSLTNNALTGTLPSVLGTMTSLQALWLYENDFQGTIPTELGNLRRLKTLSILDNPLLTGSMPQEVCANTGDRGVLDRLVADCDVIQCDCCSMCLVPS